jgi:hypothetical protein
MVNVSVKITASSNQYTNYRNQDSDTYSSDDEEDSSYDDDTEDDYQEPTTRVVNREILAKAAEKRFIGTPNTLGTTKQSIPKNKKKAIPATVKRIVWNRYIGEHIGKAKCMCCKVTDITQLSFHCGHVVSEANGGKVEVPNLRPICQNCNSSMGKINMDEFINKYKL